MVYIEKSSEARLCNSVVSLWYNAKRVNKVFAIGLRSIARGTSSQSYNKFVGLHSGVNFTISCEKLVPCRDSIILCERFVKHIANECQTSIHHEQFMKVTKYKLKCLHLTNYHSAT